MAYEKLHLIDGETVIEKDLLDHMQDGIANAYFITDDTLKLEDGSLSVNLATETDRSLPITAADVDVTVGNIKAILETI